MFRNVRLSGRMLTALLALVLIIAGSAGSSQPAVAQEQGIDLESCTLLYAVQPTDTLSEISRRFNTTVEQLQQLNPAIQDPARIFPGLVLCVSTEADVVIPPTGETPHIDIVDVDAADEVTIRASNFPANRRLDVLFGRAGTRGVDGIRAATLVTPQQGGPFTATLDIPQQLQNESRIVIRLESQTGGFFAFNTFTNTTQDGTQPADCAEFYTVRRGDTLREIAQRFDTTIARLVEINNIADPDRIFSGQRLCISTEDEIIPPTGARAAVSIQDVDAGDDVTVRGVGFPAGGTFDVLIGSADDDARGGTRVGSVNVPQNGIFRQTFDIPEDFEDTEELAIRFESTTTDQVVFVEFENTEMGEPDRFPEEEGLTLPETPVAERSTGLSAGQRISLSQGNAGVFMPSSAYNGTLHIARYDAQVAQVEDLEFRQLLLRVQVGGQGGGQVNEVRGLVYVFFEITDDTREDFDLDELTIYRFDPDDEAWEACDIPVRVDGDGNSFDRLACVIQDFGVYGLAVQQ